MDNEQLARFRSEYVPVEYDRNRAYGDGDLTGPRRNRPLAPQTVPITRALAPQQLAPQQTAPPQPATQQPEPPQSAALPPSDRLPSSYAPPPTGPSPFGSYPAPPTGEGSTAPSRHWSEQGQTAPLAAPATSPTRPPALRAKRDVTASTGPFMSVEELAVSAVLDEMKPIAVVARTLKVPMSLVEYWVSKVGG